MRLIIFLISLLFIGWLYIKSVRFVHNYFNGCPYCGNKESENVITHIGTYYCTKCEHSYVIG